MTLKTSVLDNSVVCYIRRTKEWAEEYKFSGKYESVWRATQVAMFWDRIFTISYVNFRKRLNNLQQENLKDIGFSTVIDQHQFVGYRGFVVPTDDDDLFHPDIISVLGSSNKPVLYWNFLNYNMGVISKQNSSLEAIQYESNNYAIANPQNEQCLEDHMVANAIMRNKEGFHLDTCLSLHNRSLASLSVLLPICNNKSELLNLYDKYRQAVKIECEIPSYFIPYINAMGKIYRNELKVRRSFI